MMIKLTADEAMSAATVASLQMIRKVLRDRNTDHGGTSKRGIKERWGDTINGVMGEVALAKAIDRSWTPGGRNISVGEVSFSQEVRTTDWPNGHLLIYDNDSDDAIFWHVRGSFPVFDVVGWIYGKDAKRPEWKAAGDPDYYKVPNSELSPIELCPLPTHR